MTVTAASVLSSICMVLVAMLLAFMAWIDRRRGLGIVAAVLGSVGGISGALLMWLWF